MAQSGVPEKEPYCYRGNDTGHKRERRNLSIEQSIKAVLIEQEQQRRYHQHLLWRTKAPQ